MNADEEAAGSLLESGLGQLGIRFDHAAISRLLSYCALVLAANKTTNLTSAKSLGDLVTRHVLDSVAPFQALKPASPLIDLGSGAGFPGIPLALLNPDVEVILLEPRRKRTEFLAQAIEALEIRNASVQQRTAAAALKNGVRAAMVMMRAVAPPAASLSLGLPLVRPGGVLVLYEGHASQPTAAMRALATRGEGRINVARILVPHLDATRHAWVVRKQASADVSRETSGNRPHTDGSARGRRRLQRRRPGSG